MAHGFSDRSMREQQPLIKGYVDLLVQRLAENGDGGRRAVDVAAWYNFTTFDVIGDLAFGERWVCSISFRGFIADGHSFGCLENSTYHPWVKAIFQVARAGTVFQTLTHWPILLKLMLGLVPSTFIEEREHHNEMAMAKLRRRIDAGKQRPDLIEGLLKRADEWVCHQASEQELTLT